MHADHSYDQNPVQVCVLLYTLSVCMNAYTPHGRMKPNTRAPPGTLHHLSPLSLRPHYRRLKRPPSPASSSFSPSDSYLCCQVRTSCSRIHSTGCASVYSGLNYLIRVLFPWLYSIRACGAVALLVRSLTLSAGREDVTRTCAMCAVCILLLCTLRREGGGGGESEDVTEMTSSGSGLQFLLRCGEERTRRERGGKGVFLTRDVKRRTYQRLSTSRWPRRSHSTRQIRT